MRDGIVEKSVVDFFVVFSLILTFVKHMVVMKIENHILKNYTQVGEGDNMAK